MKYRTKLYLTFCLLILGAVLLVAGFSYYETRARFFQLLKGKVIAIGSTSASLLDAQNIKTLKQSLNADSPEFQAVVTQMRIIRDANRNQETYISDIYLIEQNPKNPKEIIFLADAMEAREADYAPPGLPYPEGEKIGILNHLREPYSPGILEDDRWGKFFPSYTPIFDSDGAYIATLGVDLLAKSVMQDLTTLHWIAFNAIGIALAAGLIAATLLASQVTRSLNLICEGVTKIGAGDFQTQIQILSDDEFAKLAKEINRMAIGLKEREQLKIHFVRYVSKHIMDMIIKEEKPLVLTGEERKVTVLFSDIRHFSTLAETMPADQVLSHLNEFLSIMIDVIFEKDGTLDKFMGDGLMIEFGAPLDDPEQEKHAVETAIGMQQALHRLNQSFEARGLPKMEMVIGIHTGLAVLGNIGSEKRMEYTAIGDTVNIASRIDDAAKDFEVPILISETTWKQVQHLFKSKDLGHVQLRGKKEEVRVYSIEFSNK